MRKKVLIVAALWVAFFCTVLATKGWPHDHTRPDLNAWFKSLHSVGGMGCCDGTDAQRVDDLDWKAEEDAEFPFSVRLDGKWIKISKSQVISTPNLMGHALLFIWQGQLTCFAPGALG